MALEIMNDVGLLWPALGIALELLAEGADLLLADLTEQRLAANVAEYYEIPPAALQFYRIAPAGTSWDITQDAEDTQRRALGLPEETGPSPRQLLAIQAYDGSSSPGWRPNGMAMRFVLSLAA